MLNNLPNITTIVYMEDQLQKTSLNGYKDDVNIKAFRQIVATVSLVNIQFTLQNSHGNVTNNETNSSLISYFTDFHGINCFHVHRLH